MAKTIIIYEPTLCCSSGVCGPNPDQALIALQDTIAKAKNLGISTERYQITSNPKKFTENAAVMKLMQQKQLTALPITEVDGTIIKSGSYASFEELNQYF